MSKGKSVDERALELAVKFMAGTDTCTKCPLYENGTYCPNGVSEKTKCLKNITAHFRKLAREGR